MIDNILLEEYIVVAACKDECEKAFSEAAKSWFTSMGSKEVWNIENRQGWVFIGNSAKRESFEKRSKQKEKVVEI